MQFRKQPIVWYPNRLEEFQQMFMETLAGNPLFRLCSKKRIWSRSEEDNEDDCEPLGIYSRTGILESEWSRDSISYYTCSLTYVILHTSINIHHLLI